MGVDRLSASLPSTAKRNGRKRNRHDWLYNLRTKRTCLEDYLQGEAPRIMWLAMGIQAIGYNKYACIFRNWSSVSASLCINTISSRTTTSLAGLETATDGQ